MTRETMERIDACLAGTLDEAGFAELQREMRADPVVREHYCRQAEIHGRLEWELGEPAQAMVHGKRPAPPARVRSSRAPLWAAAAAVVALAGGFVLFRADRPPVIATDPPLEIPAATDFVARITRDTGAEWAGTGHASGAWLRAGELRLEKGSAEITFDSGATVVLEARAVLEVTSPTRARLDRGKATVHIPQQASDFVFETPSTQLSQRMTRFGVVVEDDGQSEIHVLDGRVELTGKWGQLQSLVLEKDRPVRVDGAGALLAARRYAPENFPAAQPASPDLLPPWFQHWSFDTATTAEDTFRDSGRRPDDMPAFPAQVRLASPDASVGLIGGRFGNAVGFNGRDGFLATRFPGIEGNAPRSVAFWIRIPPDTPDTFAYSMISWGSPTAGEKWQIGWNTGSDNRGTRGAIRTEVGLGYHVGSTDLRDGDWHHVVSIFLGGKDARSASHIRHYIDGRLESTTATGDRAVNTRIEGADAYPVSIGRRIEDDGVFRTFKGDLDEIYLFPLALTPEQVVSLYQSNTPPAIR